MVVTGDTVATGSAVIDGGTVATGGSAADGEHCGRHRLAERTREKPSADVQRCAITCSHALTGCLHKGGGSVDRSRRTVPRHPLGQDSGDQ